MFISLLIGTHAVGDFSLGTLFADVAQSVFGMLLLPCVLTFTLRRV